MRSSASTKWRFARAKCSRGSCMTLLLLRVHRFLWLLQPHLAEVRSYHARGRRRWVRFRGHGRNGSRSHSSPVRRTADPKSCLSVCSSRPSIGTENSIPEEMNDREIAVCMPVMNEVKFLFVSEPCKPLKPRSLYVVFLVEKDVGVK